MKSPVDQSPGASSFSVLLLATLVVLLGVAALPRLRLGLFPSEGLPSLSVSYQWNDQGARNIEQEITAPLEAMLATVQGVRHIESVSQQGRGSIRLEFDDRETLREARPEIAELLRQAYARFPEQASFPALGQDAPEEDPARQQPALAYSFLGQAPNHELEEFARRFILPKLSGIEGVERVELLGAERPQTELRVDGQRLAALGIDKNTLLEALARHFDRQHVGVGVSRTEGADWLLPLVVGRARSGDDWARIPVAEVGGRVLFLGELAQIQESPQTPRSIFRINGMNTVQIIFFASPESNMLEIIQSIKDEVSYFSPEILPTDSRLMVLQDASIRLKAELRTLYERSALTLLVLLLLTYLSARSWRYLTVIAANLLVSLSLSVLLSVFWGIELHLFSLAGVAVSLGLLIDNAIIMTDHVRRVGDRQVFMGLLAATLTTIVALGSVFLLPEEERLLLTDFAAVVVLNLATSLVVSLFLVPALLERWPQRPARRGDPRLARRLARAWRGYGRLAKLLRRRKGWVLLGVVLLFGLPIHNLPSKLEAGHWAESAYNFSWGNETVQKEWRPWLEKIFGGTLRLFSRYVFEGEIWQHEDESVLQVRARLGPGSTIEHTDTVFRRLEGLVLKSPGVDYFVSSIPHGQTGSLEVHFSPEARASTIPQILKMNLTRHAFDYGGLDWRISGFGEGYDNTLSAQNANYKVAVWGYNFEELLEQTRILQEMLLTHPRVQDMKVQAVPYFPPQSPDHLLLALDAQALALAGGRPDRLLRSLVARAPGLYPDMLLEVDGRSVPVKVTDSQSASFDRWRLLNAALASPSDTLKTAALASFSLAREPELIHKKDQEYLRVLDYNYTGATKFGDQHLNHFLEMSRSVFPPGYRAEQLDSVLYVVHREYDYRGLWGILLALLVLLAVLFNSLRQPFWVLVQIPIAYAGLFLTFYHFDIRFDSGGFAALIVLAGSAINPALYIVNDFNILKKNRKSGNLSRLYVRAVRQKIVPSLLTIASTVAGLSPFLLGDRDLEFWHALAAGVIGGSVFSLLGLLLVLPLVVRREEGAGQVPSTS